MANEQNYSGKKEWEISGNSFGKGNRKINFFDNYQFFWDLGITGNIEKMFPLTFGIRMGSLKIGNAQCPGLV